MLIGSSDGNGNSDVTPKGDKPGFVAVLDDTTIAIPDRPGNNRLDTLENVIANPSVGLLFLIPGHERDAAGQRRGAHHRRSGPARAAAGRGQAADHRDGRRRSRRPTCIAPRRSCARSCGSRKAGSTGAKLPTLGQILKDQLALADSAEATDRWLDDAYEKSMW